MKYLTKLHIVYSNFWRSAIFYCLRIFPIKKNKIVFVNFDGKGYGDNPKYICEELLKSNYSYDLVWLVNDFKSEFPLKIRKVKNRSLKSIYELCTAKIWIDNNRKPIYVKKRKKQFYIQTWHGNGFGIKKVEKDAEDKLPKEYIRTAKNDSRMVDLFFSASKWQTTLYRNSFWYSGKILNCGLPRMDIFVQDPIPITNNIYTYYGLSTKTKLILYVPTFRNDYSMDCYDIDCERLLQVAKKRFGGDWKIIVRLHPALQNKQNMFKYNKNVLNGSTYTDVDKLIVACDLLISDYSGCLFDGMVIRKRVLLYAKDYDKYMLDRGTYCDLQTLPCPLVQNNDELCTCISAFCDEQYQTSITLFLDNVQLYKMGKASKAARQVIEQIIGYNSNHNSIEEQLEENS